MRRCGDEGMEVDGNNGGGGSQAGGGRRAGGGGLSVPAEKSKEMETGPRAGHNTNVKEMTVRYCKYRDLGKVIWI
jgi:hypothetical protein